MSTITVTDITRGAIIAQGEHPGPVLHMEGTYYFPRDMVHQEHLIRSTRTFTCPYKGLMFWYDLESDHGLMRDVAWVYEQPRPGYEHLQEMFGFTFGMRPGVMVEKS